VDAVLAATESRKRVLDVPRYLHLFYWLFDIAPGLLRRLTGIGGPARSNFGAID